MKSKWFEFKGRDFKSKKPAKNLKEAWDKTLKKWQLILQGYDTDSNVGTCGLCNLYEWRYCKNCPIKNMTGQILCDNTPIKDKPALEYLFLLFVKEATYKGRNHAIQMPKVRS